MQTISKQVPRALRIAPRTTYNTTKNYTTTTTTRNNNMSLFPRFVENEFAPVFRLLQAAEDHAVSGRQGGLRALSFQPKFDVKETKEGYELQGELPGVEQKNIEVEFSDAQTLVVRGRTEHAREEGQRPAGWIDGAEQGRLTEGGDKKGRRATVEDEGQVESTAENNGEAAQREQKPASKYWVSERSVGEFARTFSFPTRVDQDQVKASLKDGILSVVVPKAPAPTSKRITVE